MNRESAANYSVTETLRDGRQVTIRAVRTDDKGRMADAIRQTSPESFYRRSFSPKRDLGDDELKRLTEAYFANVVALVAIMKEEGQERIVGGGRYIRTGAQAETAEVAFLIDDAYQGVGIGSRIFKHLAALARASGIIKFEAEVLPSNEGMLRLFGRSGLPVARTMTRDSVHVTIELTASERRRGPMTG